MNSLFQPGTNEVMRLPRTQTWAEETVHVFDSSSILAVQAAMAANRPLLVRGEPGVGKSQLARAAAHWLKRPLLCEVVHARCECQDLLFRYDAVARLGQAQVLQVSGSTEQAMAKLREERYLMPGVLWWAFAWASAKEQVGLSAIGGEEPNVPEDYEWTAEKGCVVLIDEIDKAETDIPNALLEALGNGGFHVPFSHRHVTLSRTQAKPLVIVTTNEERELPPAFVRRCLVLNMRVKADGETLEQALLRRARAHFDSNQVSERVCTAVAEQLARDREEARQNDQPLPGHAEYLDVLKALVELHGSDEAAQLGALADIAAFAFQKQTWEEGA